MDPINQIKTEGYCHISNVYTPKQTSKALSLVKKWHHKTKDKVKSYSSLTKESDFFVWNLQNKDYFFIELLTNNKQLQDILIQFLNDKWFKQIPQDQPNYILRAFLARSSHDFLPMHIDSFIPYLGNYVYGLQVSIPLEDQTVDNGCLYLTPKSHLSGRYTCPDDFQSAKPLEAKAGDLIIWDSRLWHAAGENKTKGTRWSIVAVFSRWWLKQMFNIPAGLPSDIYHQCEDFQKAILGFCSIPQNDETQGIDMKRGYGELK